MHWIIGTTDTDWQFGLDHPSATRADIDYLLGHVNAVLREPLTVDDITAVYVGLRPLVAKGAKDTAAISREHSVQRSAPGLVSIAGGKYTTYRVMARDAVDVAARELPFAVAPSRTEDIPLLGAVGSAEAPSRAPPAPRRRRPLARRRSSHLVGRYGTLALKVLDLVAEEPALADAARRGRDVPGRRGPSRDASSRARCTSTTCSRAARTSPSRPPTAAAWRSKTWPG